MNRNQLELPPLAAHPEAIEIMRVWALPGRGQEFAVRPVYRDPGAWGLLFVDLARYIADISRDQGMDPSETLRRIRQLFEAEWSSPTDTPTSVST